MDTSEKVEAFRIYPGGRTEYRPTEPANIVTPARAIDQLKRGSVVYVGSLQDLYAVQRKWKPQPGVAP